MVSGGDGQPKQRGNIQALQGVFVLDKGHEKFLYGQSNNLGRGYLLSFGLMLGFVGLVGVGILQNLLYGTAVKPPAPEFIPLFMLIPLIMGTLIVLGLFRTAREKRLYETQGQLLIGQIAAVKGAWEYQGNKRYYDVKITYEVRCPSGAVCKGSRSESRNDLSRVPLPPVGTPVAVLYVDPDHHLLL